jgi:hypothetical protein
LGIGVFQIEQCIQSQAIPIIAVAELDLYGVKTASLRIGRELTIGPPDTHTRINHKKTDGENKREHGPAGARVWQREVHAKTPRRTPSGIFFE